MIDKRRRARGRGGGELRGTGGDGGKKIKGAGNERKGENVLG